MKIVKKILSISGYVLVITGVLFKILHWPFSTTLLIAGLGVYFISVVLSFIKKDKGTEASNPEILDDI